MQADENFDLYITALSFLISDLNAVLNQFGTIGALTNGCQLIYQDQRGDVFIHDELKTNFDFIRLGLANPPFGDAATAFRANNMSGNSEGYIPVVDFRTTFSLPWGIPLKAGTNHRITLRVRDDVTGVDAFDCISYGFTRII